MSRSMHVYMAWKGTTLHLPFYIGIYFYRFIGVILSEHRHLVYNYQLKNRV